MKNFYLRTFTSIFFVIYIVFSIIYSEISFFLFSSLLLVLSKNEYFNMIKDKYYSNKEYFNLYKISYILVGLSMFIISFFVAKGIFNSKLIFLAIPLYLTLFIQELLLSKKGHINNLALNFISIIFISIPICLSNVLVFVDNKYIGTILMVVISMIWVNDAGAYIIGSLFGRNKLISHISPKKSIEGLIGGMLLVFIFSAFIANLDYFSNSFIIINKIKDVIWYFIGFSVFLCSTFGDLVESMFKRNLNVKDSGNLLPGHGGILDRFDAYLFTISFIAVIIKLFL